jgi:hypothetical protein
MQLKKINLKSLHTYSNTYSSVTNIQHQLNDLQPHTARVMIVTGKIWMVYLLLLLLLLLSLDL